MAEGPKAKCPMCMQVVKMYDSVANAKVDDILSHISEVEGPNLTEEGYEFAEEL